MGILGVELDCEKAWRRRSLRSSSVYQPEDAWEVRERLWERSGPVGGRERRRRGSAGEPFLGMPRRIWRRFWVELDCGKAWRRRSLGAAGVYQPKAVWEVRERLWERSGLVGGREPLWERSGEEVRLGSPFSRKLGPRGSPLLLVFFGAPKATLGMPRRIWRRFWGGINWN